MIILVVTPLLKAPRLPTSVPQADRRQDRVRRQAVEQTLPANEGRRDGLSPRSSNVGGGIVEDFKAVVFDGQGLLLVVFSEVVVRQEKEMTPSPLPSRLKSERTGSTKA